MMTGVRSLSVSAIATVWAITLLPAMLAGPPAAAQTFAVGLPPCKNTFPMPGAETPSQVEALALLGSVTQLDSPRGRPVLAANLATVLAINNQASAAARAQALKDALITDFNANALADGLGATMARIYRDKAPFQSRDDGRTRSCGEIGPAVSAFIAAANRQSGGDSNAGKFAFANGLHGKYQPPAQGILDVFGKAYGHPAGGPGADRNGNSRPFQSAPIGATKGPAVRTYDGTDFFGVASHSRVVLTGATPADLARGLTGSDLRDSPSFPSGHTTYGYTAALALAMLVPERLRALAYRASEYGDSRIVIGAHYPLDVIAGRTLATYDLAQDLAGRPNYARVDGRSFRAGLAAAARELRGYLRTHGCPNLAVCAREPIVRAADATIVADGRVRPATPRGSYFFRLTYGLPPLGAASAPPEPVPDAAADLLWSRFPYLDADQRRDILRSTEGPSGRFLDASPVDERPLSAGAGPSAQAGAYSRLDLFAAAGGYARLDRQVVVDQDAAAIKDDDLRPFADLARVDTWTNDISGHGGLTKRGPGTLILAGTCTYAGATRVEGGTLVVAGSVRAPTAVSGGTLSGNGRTGDIDVARESTLAPAGGTLAVAGSLALADGAVLRLQESGSVPALRVDRKVRLDGAILFLRQSATLKPGASVTIVEAKGGIEGTFAKVRTDTPALVANLTYGAHSVELTLDAADAPGRTTR